ncbi:DcaP family trimeric outer membrane transporter [Acinetobacter sp.]|uniref:DcaP family trimeric outer membrane transporter n=1 Tax=Acinetobacter sp. TaxID=472 RepID=UPI0035B319AD
MMYKFSEKPLNKFRKIIMGTLIFYPVYSHAEKYEDKINELSSEIIELKEIVAKQQQDFGEIIQAKSSSNNKSGVLFNFYGFIRADASYQFNGGNGIFNRINKVDLDGISDNEDKFYSTLTTTRLGLDINSSKENQPISGKLEIDFRGGTNNDTIRIRHAYLDYNNFLIGQTTSSFVDTDNHPQMLDFGSPLGIGSGRTPMLRYSNNLNSQTKYFVGLEQGRTENRLPSLTSKLKYNYQNGNGSASLRGLAQEVRVKELNDKTKFSWGLGLGTNYKLNNYFQINADYSHVKGDSNFILYTNSAYNYSENDEIINLNEFDSFTLGLTYKINPKLQSTLAYGAMFSNNNNKFSETAISNNDTSQNKRLQQGWINLMYSPIIPLTVGVEYIYGERETFTGETGKDSRLSTMVKYSF